MESYIYDIQEKKNVCQGFLCTDKQTFKYSKHGLLLARKNSENINLMIS